MQKLVRSVLQFWREHVGTKILPLLSTVRIVGLLIAILALSIFTFIADEVLEKETQAFDTAFLLELANLHRPWLDRVMVFITDLGRPSFLLIVCLGISIGLLYRQQRSQATTLAIAAAGAVVLNTFLKNSFVRDRPMLWQYLVDVHYYSFPSGHAMVSLVVYGMVGYLLAKHFPQQKSFIAFCTVLAIGVIGFSRLYLGVHWLTDVVGGYAAGLVWLIACIFSAELWQSRQQKNLS
jgi:membrane-associated phospholipid phosphatase